MARSKHGLDRAGPRPVGGSGARGGLRGGGAVPREPADSVLPERVQGDFPPRQVLCETARCAESPLPHPIERAHHAPCHGSTRTGTRSRRPSLSSKKNAAAPGSETTGSHSWSERRGPHSALPARRTEPPQRADQRRAIDSEGGRRRWTRVARATTCAPLDPRFVRNEVRPS
jgi:hypothetical protein